MNKEEIENNPINNSNSINPQLQIQDDIEELPAEYKEDNTSMDENINTNNNNSNNNNHNNNSNNNINRASSSYSRSSKSPANQDLFENVYEKEFGQSSSLKRNKSQS